MRANKNPLVSIITVTYNSSSTIVDTLNSMLNQTYDNLEYIVVDGKSGDNTMEIVESYIPKFRNRGISVKVKSEKDKGIADAWNKGLNMSTGDIIGMLNSDDWYEDQAVEKAVQCLDVDVLQLSYGICKRVNEKKEVIEVMDVQFNPRRLYINFGFSYTTCFFTRRLQSEIGGFNLKYRIAIDTDFLLRAYKKGMFVRCTNITYMRLGGISTKFEKEALREYQMALRANGFNPLMITFMGALKKIYLYVRRLKD